MANLFLQEFEITEDKNDGGYFAFPFDLPGMTEGFSYEDTLEMAADYTQTWIDDFVINNRPIPAYTLGHTPQHGGTIVLIAIHYGKELIPRVTQTEAARMLGVTPARVNALIKSNLLETVTEGGTKWVTLGSIHARLNDLPMRGRPKKNKEKEPVLTA